MKIEIEIPDTAEFNKIADEDMVRIVAEAICTSHWYEHAGTELDLSHANIRVIDSVWTREPSASFGVWLKSQVQRDDVVGDLAKDAANAPARPHNRATKADWRNYLGNRQHIVDALEEAWSEFLASKKKS